GVVHLAAAGGRGPPGRGPAGPGRAAGAEAPAAALQAPHRAARASPSHVGGKQLDLQEVPFGSGGFSSPKTPDPLSAPCFAAGHRTLASVTARRSPLPFPPPARSLRSPPSPQQTHPPPPPPARPPAPSPRNAARRAFEDWSTGAAWGPVPIGNPPASPPAPD